LDTPRKLPEDEVGALIESRAAAVTRPERAIFNLHVPPKDTPIDQAILLDDELRPRMLSGSPIVGGVGSSAVRDAIERHQPMLGLHGHIHESRGEVKIGRTVSLNPGSEYGEGVLRGGDRDAVGEEGPARPAVRGGMSEAVVAILGSARLTEAQPRCRQDAVAEPPLMMCITL